MRFLVDLVVFAFLSLVFCGAMHMHDKRCERPSEHQFSHAAQAASKR